MAELKYDILTSTSDESQNLKNSLAFITMMNDTYWEAKNPKNYEIVNIKFKTPSLIRNISLKTIQCSGVEITLYNLSHDGIKIQDKQLEKQKFLSQNHKALISNSDNNENYYEYADITFRSMGGSLSIGYILFYGTINSKQQNLLQNNGRPSLKQYERFVPQFPLYKSDNSEKKLVIEPAPSSSALKTQFNPSISQRSAQIVNKAKIQANLTNLFSRSENKPQQLTKRSQEDSEYQQALYQSLKTYQFETEKQSKSMIEEEIQEQLDSFYDDENLENFCNKAEQQNKSFDKEFENSYRAALQEQKKFTQQKEQIKQTLFTQTKNQPERIIIVKTKASSDLDLEQMTQYNEKMIHQDFVQYHNILEDSFFRGDKLFAHMNKQFKPLQGHIIYIKPDGITEFECRRLELKAQNLGAKVEKQITDQTSIIISDTPLLFDDKMANILVLNQKFLESCPPDNFLKVDKYIIK